MSPIHLRVEYDSLDTISRDLRRMADQVDDALFSIQHQVAGLQSGGWLGEAASAFYDEVEVEVYPHLKRLSEYMQDTARGVGVVINLFQDTDESIRPTFGGGGASLGAFHDSLTGMGGLGAGGAGGGSALSGSPGGPIGGSGGAGGGGALSGSPGGPSGGDAQAGGGSGAGSAGVSGTGAGAGGGGGLAGLSPTGFGGGGSLTMTGAGGYVDPFGGTASGGGAGGAAMGGVGMIGAAAIAGVIVGGALAGGGAGGTGGAGGAGDQAGAGLGAAGANSIMGQIDTLLRSRGITLPPLVVGMLQGVMLEPGIDGSTIALGADASPEARLAANPQFQAVLQAIYNNPTDPHGYLEMAMLLEQGGFPEQAAQSYQAFLMLADPYSVPAEDISGANERIAALAGSARGS